MADEEDVALSAFDSFCRGVEAGRFPQLRGRDDLWAVLGRITFRKAADLHVHENRRKRGDGTLRILTDLDALVGDELTPEFAALVTEEYRRLLHLLGDEVLCQIAVRKMEGYTDEEVAGLLGCVTRTVERKLRLIRQIWDREDRP